MSRTLATHSRPNTDARADQDTIAPRVWAVLSERAGDDVQILALARALGWPFEIKRLKYRFGSRLIDVFRGANRWGIVRGESAPLEPPWPDLVLSASMRNEPVCRWIRNQSHGRTRYVHLGKPWAKVPTFDLVITVPEYRWLRDQPNLLRNEGSLHEVTPERLMRESQRHADRVASLPPPYLAVIVGGYAGPYPFDKVSAARLGRAVSKHVRQRGGSLLITTSKRTSAAACRSLQDSLDAPYTLFEWKEGDEPNPYLGFLGLADEIVVTCDSTSMLAEACATGKPVHLFDLHPECDDLDPHSPPWWRRLSSERVTAFGYRHLLLRFAPNKLKRDISQVHARLVDSGRAVWLGSPFAEKDQPPPNDLARAVARVRALCRADR